MEEQIITLSIRNTSAIWSLFSRAQFHQASLNRNELFREAVQHAISIPKTDWKHLAANGSSELLPNADSMKDCPIFLQFRVPRLEWEELLTQITGAFNPTLKRVKTAWVIKLTMLNFVLYLDEVNKTEAAEEKATKEEDISPPEMAAILTSMILGDSELLAPIKKIMLEYKTKRKGEQK